MSLVRNYRPASYIINSESWKNYRVTFGSECILWYTWINSSDASVTYISSAVARNDIHLERKFLRKFSPSSGFSLGLAHELAVSAWGPGLRITESRGSQAGGGRVRCHSHATAADGVHRDTVPGQVRIRPQICMRVLSARPEASEARIAKK